MAKLNAKDIIDTIKEMTILELKELNDLMKDELGIDPSAIAVAAPAAGAAAADDSANAAKTVVLKSAGAQKIAGNIKENVPADEANDIKAKLEEAGATVELA